MRDGGRGGGGSGRAALSRRRKAYVEAKSRSAGVYRRACARLGQPPALEICQDLREHGALVVDMLLCRDLESIRLFLREAPVGIQQLVFYDGALFFGHDPHYRVKWRAVRCRHPRDLLRDDFQLRRLVGALTVFCSARGGGLAVLELTGLPLGRELRTLLSPIARCLSDLPALQRLHLMGCGLQDSGLVLLLPHIAGTWHPPFGTPSLPKLSHLSLARNGLCDGRLIALFLEGRSAAQKKRHAAALSILDLSENPNLGTFPATRAEATAAASANASFVFDVPSVSRTNSATLMHSSLPIRFPKLTGGACIALERVGLFGTICEALQGGLLLRTLRLRSMDLHKDDLRPLLQLLYREVAHRQAGFHGNFPLKEVSLEGNPLDAEFPAAISNALRRLELHPPSARCGIGNGTDTIGSGSGSGGQVASGSTRRSFAAHTFGSSTSSPTPVTAAPFARRARSTPLLEKELVRSPDLATPEPERDAVSECDADVIAQGPEYNQQNAQGRALLRQQLEDDCAVLAARLDSPAVSPRGKRRPWTAVDGRPRLRTGMAPPLREDGAQRSQRAWSRSGSGKSDGERETGALSLGQIPDRGAEFGFGPPPGVTLGLVGFPFDTHGAHGLLGSDSEDSVDSAARAARAHQRHRGDTTDRTAQQLESDELAPRGSEVNSRRPQPTGHQHARLETLHRVFQEGANSIQVGPEVLQYALDVVSSDSNLFPTECDEEQREVVLRQAFFQLLADSPPREGIDDGEHPHGDPERDEQDVPEANHVVGHLVRAHSIP